MQIRMKSVLLWGACLALVGLGILGAVHFAKPPVVIAVSDTALPRSVDAGDASRTKGDANAPVQIVVYSDFQCPSCGYFADNLHGLPADASGRVRVVYRYFPLPQHSNAILAATAAEAAAMQGKFWEMHDLLFADKSKRSDEDLKAFAGQLGLDVAKWEKDFKDPATAQKIQDDIAACSALEVRGAPGFLINGRLLSGAQPFEVFKGVIEEELAGGFEKKQAAAPGK